EVHSFLHWMPARTELNHLLNLPCRPRFLAAAPKAFALAKIDICFHRMRPPPASALKLQSPYRRSAPRPIRHAALQHACRCHTVGLQLAAPALGWTDGFAQLVLAARARGDGVTLDGRVMVARQLPKGVPDVTIAAE